MIEEVRGEYSLRLDIGNLRSAQEMLREWRESLPAPTPAPGKPRTGFLVEAESELG